MLEHRSNDIELQPTQLLNSILIPWSQSFTRHMEMVQDLVSKSLSVA